TDGRAVLDGSVTHGNWFYAVATTGNYGVGIPTSPEIGNSTTHTELWVRPMPKCGNGVKESNEMCDDGNAVDGDGCSSTCALERTAYKTCREILDAKQDMGDGTYVVDPDGAGGAAGFPVYCDMTNDGGGWTLIGKAGAGKFTDLTDEEYVNLFANPKDDVNVGALTE
ncbi:MAG: DUF4215 domain-containing protein, partial [Myxococcales bacterium]|nr:DUF4215 domain-containing protein [Myxococcales bacterium]